jgi:hypothetical protein
VSVWDCVFVELLVILYDTVVIVLLLNQEGGGRVQGFGGPNEALLQFFIDPLFEKGDLFFWH